MAYWWFIGGFGVPKWNPNSSKHSRQIGCSREKAISSKFHTCIRGITCGHHLLSSKPSPSLLLPNSREKLTPPFLHCKKTNLVKLFLGFCHVWRGSKRCSPTTMHVCHCFTGQLKASKSLSLGVFASTPSINHYGGFPTNTTCIVLVA